MTAAVESVGGAVPLSGYAAPGGLGPQRAARSPAIDCLRGIVMVIMALDHTREFVSGAPFPPVDLAHTTPALFLTRWVTHFCAPVFFLLAGLGAALSLSRGRTRRDMSKFFLTRGLWLVALELTVVAVGWNFSLHVVPWSAGVFWALGWSMVLMSAIIWLPRSVIAAVALVLIALHNATDALQPEAFGSLSWLWRFLHFPDPQPSAPIHIDYPLVPWVAVMALGYCLGPLFQDGQERRRRALIGVGATAVVGFLVLRGLNVYGDPQPWSVQRSGVFTVLSFLRVRKYPPSLAYLLMTLGPALIVLASLERARGRIVSVLVVYGRVPLLFYVLHIFLAHAVAVAIAFWQGGTAYFLIGNGAALADHPTWYGVSLPLVYLTWIFIVVALYPVCRAFAEVKARRRDWWLSYL